MLISDIGRFPMVSFKNKLIKGGETSSAIALYLMIDVTHDGFKVRLFVML